MNADRIEAGMGPLLWTDEHFANPMRLGFLLEASDFCGGFREATMPSSERPKLKDPDRKTVTLTEKDLKDAVRLFRLLADPALVGHDIGGFLPSEEKATAPGDRQSLAAKARMVLSSRLAREQYFQRDLFGEPAWEILLALYVVEESGARFTISKLAECINAPLSTVVRWVKTLEEQSLVSRVNHQTDRRIIFVRLVDKGRKALDDYLGAIPG